VCIRLIIDICRIELILCPSEIGTAKWLEEAEKGARLSTSALAVALESKNIGTLKRMRRIAACLA